MKKIGWMKLLFFVFLCFKFGTCDSPCTPDISIDSLKLDTIQAKSICQIYPKDFVDDNKKAFFDENCFAENSEIGFVSLLDTTVAFFISWEKTLFGLHYGEIINSAPKLIQTIPHTVLQEHMHLVKSLNLN